MVKVIMHGYLGKMGRVICGMNTKEIEVVAGVDALPAHTPMPFPTYMNIRDCDMPADVIIDFSTAVAVPGLINYAVAKKIPVVVCTTGLTQETLAAMQSAAAHVAVFKSANMSLGINFIASVISRAAGLMRDSGFDMEIIEKHHNQKIDAPSGTALLLADALNEALDGQLEYVFDRSTTATKRKSNELGLHAIRGGNIVGEHTVLFAGADEVIEFTHIAQSKEVFAVGAVKAANFLKGKTPGMYSMQDVMDNVR